MGLIKKFRIKSFKGNETIVELKNVSVFYNKLQILNNLNLEIKRQEILECWGPTVLVNQQYLIHNWFKKSKLW